METGSTDILVMGCTGNFIHVDSDRLIKTPFMFCLLPKLSGAISRVVNN